MPVATGWIDIPTGVAVGASISTPFLPKAAYFMAATWEGDGFHGVPGATAANQARLAVGIASNDGVSATSSVFVNAQAAFVLNDAHANFGTAHAFAGFNNVVTEVFDITSWNTAGLTLSVTATEAVRVYYMILGGNDFQSAAGTFTVESDGSDTTVTGLPFEPQALWTVSAKTTLAEAVISTGAAASNGQWYNGFNVPDNDRDAFHTGGTDAVIGDESDGDWRAALDSFTSDGFVISPVDPPTTDRTVGYVAFRDDHADAGFAVGTDDWDDATEAVTGLGFQPGGLLMMSGIQFNLGGESAQVAAGVMGPSGGGAVSGGVYFAGGVDDPWVPPRFHYQETDTDSPLVMWSTASQFVPPTVEPDGLMARLEVDSLDADGFTYTMTTAQTGPGGVGIPTATWPALPVTPLFWFAAGTSPFTRKVAQIFRRL